MKLVTEENRVLKQERQLVESLPPFPQGDESEQEGVEVEAHSALLGGDHEEGFGSSYLQSRFTSTTHINIVPVSSGWTRSAQGRTSPVQRTYQHRMKRSCLPICGASQQVEEITEARGGRRRNNEIPMQNKSEQVH